MRRSPRRGPTSGSNTLTVKVERLEARELLSANHFVMAAGIAPQPAVDVADHHRHHHHHQPKSPGPAQVKATAGSVVPSAHSLIHVLPMSPGSGVRVSPSLTTVTSPPAGAYSPAKVRLAYGFNQIFFSSTPGDGRGQTIAIVEAYDDPNIQSDLNYFDGPKGYNLPPLIITKVNQTGGTAYPARDASGGWALETALDVEWVHAMAPAASILLVEANSANDPDLLAAIDYARSHANVVSMSFGASEFSTETSIAYQGHLVNPGVTFVASSGDSGAPAIWPAVSPTVLAVGGTNLQVNADNSYKSETGWSGSGGGVSSYFAKPTYQPGSYYSKGSNGATQATSTMRMNPDVAYDGDPNTGFAVYNSVPYYPYYPLRFGAQNGWFQIGGTSAGAPQWAALVAIADQGRTASGTPALNASDPQEALTILYQNPAAFHDVTSGDSAGTTPLYSGPGYDLVTGLGSPQANLVVTALVNPPPVVLATPAHFTASPDNAGPITLSWDATAGATSYQIYRAPTGSTASSATLIIDTSRPNTPTVSTLSGQLSVQNTTVTATSSYNYYIRATYSSGQSPMSLVAATATASTNTLFQDSFTANDLFPGANWQTVNGTWFQDSTASLLQQTNTITATTSDPEKAIVSSANATATSSSLQVFTKFRVDTWRFGEYARVGVSVNTNVSAQGTGASNAAGAGDAFVIRDRNGGQHNTLQFLNDGVVWGNQYAFALTLGIWYDMKMESRGGVLYASVWQDGTSEPDSWQFVQTGWTDRTAGAPALVGGAAGKFASDPQSSYATASFQNVKVTGNLA